MEWETKESFKHTRHLQISAACVSYNEIQILFSLCCNVFSNSTFIIRYIYQYFILQLTTKWVWSTKSMKCCDCRHFRRVRNKCNTRPIESPPRECDGYKTDRREHHVETIRRSPLPNLQVRWRGQTTFVEAAASTARRRDRCRRQDGRRPIGHRDRRTAAAAVGPARPLHQPAKRYYFSHL